MASPIQDSGKEQKRTGQIHWGKQSGNWLYSRSVFCKRIQGPILPSDLQLTWQREIATMSDNSVPPQVCTTANMTLLLLTKGSKIDSAPGDSSISSPQIASQSDGSSSISNDVVTPLGATHSREMERTKRRCLDLGVSTCSQPVGSQIARRPQDTGTVRTDLPVSDAANAGLQGLLAAAELQEIEHERSQLNHGGRNTANPSTLGSTHSTLSLPTTGGVFSLDSNPSSLIPNSMDSGSVAPELQRWQPSQNNGRLPRNEQDGQQGNEEYNSASAAQAFRTMPPEPFATDTMEAELAKEIRKTALTPFFFMAEDPTLYNHRRTEIDIVSSNPEPQPQETEGRPNPHFINPQQSSTANPPEQFAKRIRANPSRADQLNGATPYYIAASSPDSSNTVNGLGEGNGASAAQLPQQDQLQGESPLQLASTNIIQGANVSTRGLDTASVGRYELVLGQAYDTSSDNVNDGPDVRFGNPDPHYSFASSQSVVQNVHVAPQGSLEANNHIGVTCGSMAPLLLPDANTQQPARGFMQNLSPENATHPALHGCNPVMNNDLTIDQSQSNIHESDEGNGALPQQDTSNDATGENLGTGWMHTAANAIDSQWDSMDPNALWVHNGAIAIESLWDPMNPNALWVHNGASAIESLWDPMNPNALWVNNGAGCY